MVGSSTRSLTGAPAGCAADAHLVVVVLRAHDVADFDLVEAHDRQRDVQRDDVSRIPTDCDLSGRWASRACTVPRSVICSRVWVACALAKVADRIKDEKHPQCTLDVVQHGKTPYRAPITKARLEGRLRASQLWKGENALSERVTLARTVEHLEANILDTAPLEKIAKLSNDVPLGIMTSARVRSRFTVPGGLVARCAEKLDPRRAGMQGAARVFALGCSPGAPSLRVTATQTQSAPEAERTIQNLNVTPAENRVKSTFPG